MKELVDEHRELLEEFVSRGHTAINEVNKLLGKEMNLESRLKADLVSACRDLGAYARRHEDRYAIGLLDLSIKFPGHPHLLAEGKIIEHQKFAPTLRQYEEGRRYIAAGGLAVLLGWDKKTRAMFIAHPWAKEAFKADCFPSGGSYKGHAETLKDWLEWLVIK